jgi:hypothetical protein
MSWYVLDHVTSQFSNFVLNSQDSIYFVVVIRVYYLVVLRIRNMTYIPRTKN